jgi:hypothetical protein
VCAIGGFAGFGGAWTAPPADARSLAEPGAGVASKAGDALAGAARLVRRAGMVVLVSDLLVDPPRRPGLGLTPKSSQQASSPRGGLSPAVRALHAFEAARGAQGGWDARDAALFTALAASAAPPSRLLRRPYPACTWRRCCPA